MFQIQYTYNETKCTTSHIRHGKQLIHPAQMHFTLNYIRSNFMKGLSFNYTYIN